MSFDIQLVRDIGVSNVAMVREHAIFLEAQRSDRRVHKARNIADLLERGHKAPKNGGMQGVLIDVKA
jgi:hypothetical protein